MKQMLAISIILLLVLTGCTSSGNTDKSNSVTLNEQKKSPLAIEPIEGIRDDFARGVDISTLIEMEEHGQVYYDEEGNAKDLFEILKDHNVNWIRIRLWNDPYDVPWSDTLSKDGNIIEGPIGGGTNDLVKAVALSKRAKEAGMKVLLDFHYSDFWADPGKQNKPAAWEGHDFEALKKALYQFTYDSLKTMQEENCLPDMVQVGNEINNGLVFPDGQDIMSKNAFELLEQGTSAVRDIAEETSYPIKIMIHLAEGGDRSMFVKVFDRLTEQGLDYDVIGVSFYPYWHGTLTQLQLNLKTLEERYHKEVAVAEVAYGYGTGDGDQTGNIFNETLELAGGYKASVLGQASCIRDIMDVVSHVNNEKGFGIFYWEPAWLTPEGTGWVTGDGNAWENQAMFDVDGKVLDSLDVFYSVYGDQVVTKQYVGVDPITFKIDQGQKVTLPYRVSALFSNDRFESMTVKWDNLPLNYNSVPGTYTVKGIVEDNQEPVTAIIDVIESHNVLKNGGFENGLADWTIDPAIMKLGKEGENPYTGYYALNYWAAGDFSGEMTSTVEQLENGTYEVTAWVMGASLGQSASYMKVTSGGKEYTAAIEVTGFNDWKKLVITDIEVSDGTLTLGIQLDEVGGSWGWIDDFKVSPVQ